MANFMIAQLDALAPVRCPCGWARRAFATGENTVATMHLVDIESDSQPHYHRRMTELYLVLEGEGEVELDGEVFPVKPLTAIFIRPGCRHRAVGKLRIVNVPVPAFDPGDEWFDREAEESEVSVSTRRQGAEILEGKEDDEDGKL